LSESFHQFGQRVISGKARGFGASALRFAFAAVSPIYASIMRLRNLKFDRGISVKRLPKPVISIGNLTAGGTGKTPVVRWLCERLRESGGRPAVLMRGYKAKAGERGDEQAMLETLLNREGLPPVTVHAQADRHAGGLAVLRNDPAITAFILDDGFQHRRLARDFDLVLIDACEPFGFGHTFPRGLLREPPSGLRRADAILITRADQAADIDHVERLIKRHNASAPIFRCSHTHAGLRSTDSALHPLETLAGKKFFAFAGIGNPQGLASQLKQLPGELVASHWFTDHFHYSRQEITQLLHQAKAASAQAIVTTEKDWVKIAPLLEKSPSLPIYRIELAIKFAADDENELFEMIRSTIQATSHE
jgi:tetraacyldisaccharide 4'-kinase